MNIVDIHKELLNRKITYEIAQQILYDFDRNKRFEVFIALNDSTLKNDSLLSFRVFREAYCSSDNIFKQIKNSIFTFNLKGYLNNLQNNGFDFINAMYEEERKYYNDLPNNLKIYRGISQIEQDSKDYGISWSLSREMATNYIYYSKNEVENGNGGIIDIDIEKQNILTVFSVHGDKEIIYIVND